MGNVEHPLFLVWVTADKCPDNKSTSYFFGALVSLQMRRLRHMAARRARRLAGRFVVSNRLGSGVGSTAMLQQLQIVICLLNLTILLQSTLEMPPGAHKVTAKRGQHTEIG
jgi:hypothetical protein